MGEVQLKITPVQSLQQKYNLINKKQKAKELGISIRTLLRWINKDKIKYTYIPGSTKRWFFKK